MKKFPLNVLAQIRLTSPEPGDKEPKLSVQTGEWDILLIPCRGF